MYSPPVAFHSSQVSSLFLDGGQTTSFCANHWYLSSCEHIFLSSYYPNFATFYSFLQNFCASDSSMMWRFARRCLLSDQLRHVLSKQNKSNRPLPILLHRRVTWKECIYIHSFSRKSKRCLAEILLTSWWKYVDMICIPDICHEHHERRSCKFFFGQCKFLQI